MSEQQQKLLSQTTYILRDFYKSFLKHPYHFIKTEAQVPENTFTFSSQSKNFQYQDAPSKDDDFVSYFYSFSLDIFIIYF